ncbi:Redox-sensitive transcriptional regulator (AT-rich DNA-binding protein) [Lactococcus lactis subsp. lactis]|uniref:Redox-sensing transcriptional repressor Rex n=2 Tax=Lactococcus lactis TaxID=1358 RepID=A0A2A5SJA0_LACLH|nr:redox-sensing transcriptional repressor Rex [Lactococcus lactis]KAA8703823.1 redox-sensing transcriptional repressor Rex [Lactococcus lactis subsp. hordniae]KSU09544.1 Redox-sensitive transcriptional regulator (AT-rich DNA-binding protein) [Lactococcus lactis subsp. lactis]MCT3135823.1 redox-sensing transcriptional repressor Rex [Lactococcus lactis]PCS13552.1 Redox-sensing transcriptional repressor rex [Lactococcus lactis subsp. hordniae]
MTDHKPNKILPKATAKRLPQYYRLFKSLVEENVTRTNSQLISEKIGVDAATIRRDFSLFGELGRRGYGYETKVLRDFFGELLGQDQETHIALIGVGNLGRALLHYQFQDRNKMRITQAYDISGNPLVGTQTDDGIPIYNISDLEKNVKKSDIKTAILSVRKENAQEVVDTLVKAGIKGFLNFAPIRLKVPSDVVVQSIDLTKELQTLLFFMGAQEN